ncbi:hypothetical protein K438DRAFT_1518282, partial [Mycena galopus ATCC 62051]
PDLYLDEIQLQLIMMHNVNVSLPTLCQTLHHLGYTSKKLSRVAAERNAQKVKDVEQEISQYLADYLGFVDKAAVNILTTYRTNAWS